MGSFGKIGETRFASPDRLGAKGGGGSAVKPLQDSLTTRLRQMGTRVIRPSHVEWVRLVISRSAGVPACGFGRRLAARLARDEETRPGTVPLRADDDGRVTPRARDDSF